MPLGFVGLAEGMAIMMVCRRVVLAAAVAVLWAAGMAGSVSAQDAEHAGVHQPAVDALKAWDVFDGTGCADGGGLCPGEPLRRWEMAVWLVRVLDGEEPPEVAQSRFADVDGDAWWAAHAERLAELEVTRGCAAEPLRFCPDQAVNRGQMGAFLVRAFGLSEGPSAGFVDVGADHTFAADIDALAQARVTVGCGGDPPRYCPQRSVTRGEMATFLARAIGLIEAPGAVSSSVGSVAAGGFHSCAAGPDGNLACWGDDFFGQADAPEGRFVSVAGGEFHSCGLRGDGSAVCWGYDQYGQADAPAGGFESVSAGGFHSCGLRGDGSAVCWGDDRHGQADAPAGGFESVSAGGFHSCGLRGDGSAVCWGNNELRQTAAPGGVFVSLSAGSTHSCGVTVAGEVVCWGNDDDGQATPADGSFVSVSAGGFHSCGVTAGGEVVCWGDDDDGQATPVDGSFVSVSAGGFHSCGVTAGGEVVCWGDDDDGQAQAPGNPDA